MSDVPGSLESLRGSNRARVLQNVQRCGAVSRVDIARSTGLSRSTVSSLVAELLADQLLVERPDRPAGAPVPAIGRPATLLTLNPRGGAVLGVHLGHDSIRVGLADLSGKLMAEARRQIDVDHRAEDSLDYAAHAATELLRAEAMTAQQITGCGVAVSAPVRGERPAPQAGSIFTDWTGVEIGSGLRKRLGTEVHVGNDANLGAIAEWTLGAGRGAQNLIYVMLSDGVGAGLIFDGHLYEGATETAGELGHTVVAPDGLVCRCGGRGCLETLAGGRALVQALAQHARPPATLDEVVELAVAGDPGAVRVIRDAGRAVGQALAGVFAVLDPGLVVVGGKTSAAGDPLLAGLREELLRRLPPALADGVRVVRGTLGDRAEVLGAIALAGRRAPLPLIPRI